MTKSFLQFELKVQGLNLHLRFSGPDHEHWLSVFTEVSTDPFSGAYSFQMLTSELEDLIQKLQALEQCVGKESEVVWENYEGNMHLKLSLGTRGQLVGAYRFAASSGWQGANLSGQFVADQSYLGGWIRQLEQVQSELGRIKQERRR